MEADTAKRIFGILDLYFDDQKVLSAKKNGVSKPPPYFCPVLYFGV